MAFTFASVGHFFASVAHDIKVGITFLQNHQQAINADLQVGTTVLSLVDPALAPIATTIDRAGESLLGDALAIVSKLDGAAAAQGTSIPLDAAAVASFKTLIADIEKLKPGSTTPPAGLPTTA